MSESRLRVGELCAGYGGLSLAVEYVMGAETAWLAEIDSAARRVLAVHWPDVPLYGDVTAIEWSAVPPVDILGRRDSLSGPVHCRPACRHGRGHSLRPLGGDAPRHRHPRTELCDLGERQWLQVRVSR